jgi:hypothetical protein
MVFHLAQSWMKSLKATSNKILDITEHSPWEANGYSASVRADIPFVLCNLNNELYNIGPCPGLESIKVKETLSL